MLGIDLEEVKRFKLARTNSFIQSFFSPAEIKYAFAHTSPALHLAGMYCAKEAYSKASGAKQIHYSQIELLHLPSGKPYLIVNGKKIRAQVSISHTKTHAVACVLLK